MKRIFIWLLNHYSSTEKGRIEIMKTMESKVTKEYSEQTPYGNVYNYFIEFAMANPFIVKCTLNKDNKDKKLSLNILKSGIQTSFDEAVGFIERRKSNHGIFDK